MGHFIQDYYDVTIGRETQCASTAESKQGAF